MQPIYVVDNGRTSVPYELKAMKDIMNLLENKDASAKFLPLKVIKKEDISEDQEILYGYCCGCARGI